jgi:hypothetical protein
LANADDTSSECSDSPDHDADSACSDSPDHDADSAYSSATDYDDGWVEEDASDSDEWSEEEDLEDEWCEEEDSEDEFTEADDSPWASYPRGPACGIDIAEILQSIPFPPPPTDPLEFVSLSIAEELQSLHGVVQIGRAAPPIAPSPLPELEL